MYQFEGKNRLSSFDSQTAKIYTSIFFFEGKNFFVYFSFIFGLDRITVNCEFISQLSHHYNEKNIKEPK
jgi:hypothetical protein